MKANIMERFIVIISGVLLLYYYFKNKHRAVERFYYKKSAVLFLTLELSYFVIMVSFFFNLRYILEGLLKRFNR